jgi:hypothetical protein
MYIRCSKFYILAGPAADLLKLQNPANSSEARLAHRSPILLKTKKLKSAFHLTVLQKNGKQRTDRAPRFREDEHWSVIVPFHDGGLVILNALTPERYCLKVSNVTSW